MPTVGIFNMNLQRPRTFIMALGSCCHGIMRAFQLSFKSLALMFGERSVVLFIYFFCLLEKIINQIAETKNPVLTTF